VGLVIGVATAMLFASLAALGALIFVAIQQE
jgi:hypothetical protein